jgi:hypothetical protein
VPGYTTAGRRVAVSFAVVAGAAACATGGARPRYGALPEAVVVTQIIRAPTLVIGDVETAVRRAGLTVARYAPAEGFLETRWFDITTRAVTTAPYTHLNQTVRLRFYADPDQGKTRLVAEAVRMIAWDPSLPERDLERMVPATHPGRVLLDSLLAPLRPDTTTGGPPLRP